MGQAGLVLITIISTMEPEKGQNWSCLGGCRAGRRGQVGGRSILRLQKRRQATERPGAEPGVTRPGVGESQY